MTNVYLSLIIFGVINLGAIMFVLIDVILNKKFCWKTFDMIRMGLLLFIFAEIAPLILLIEQAPSSLMENNQWLYTSLETGNFVEAFITCGIFTGVNLIQCKKEYNRIHY